MNKIKSAILLLLVSALLVPMAFGRAQDLDKPSLAFPQASALREKVMRVISSKQIKFLHGRMINASTTLQYAGDSTNLNAFLEQLAKCEGATVNVSFSGDKSDTDWTLAHNALSDASEFSVIVHTARIPESEVRIPKRKTN